MRDECFSSKRVGLDVDVDVGIAVVPLLRLYVVLFVGNTGTIASTGTIPHTATTVYSCMCQAIPQALYRATGTIEPLLCWL